MSRERIRFKCLGLLRCADRPDFPSITMRSNLGFLSTPVAHVQLRKLAAFLSGDRLCSPSYFFSADGPLTEGAVVPEFEGHFLSGMALSGNRWASFLCAICMAARTAFLLRGVSV